MLQASGFEFKTIQEIGFSNKDLAKRNELFAKFSNCQSSVFYEILYHNFLGTNELYQIWIYDIKTGNPIGLSIAVVFEEAKIIYSANKKYKQDPGMLIGQIHCYIKPEYRGLGLIKKTIPVLEKFLYKKCPMDKIPCIVMQDKAYSLAKYTKNCVVFPNSLMILQQNISLYDGFLDGDDRFLKYEKSDFEPVEELENKTVKYDFIETLSQEASKELLLAKQ